MIKERTVIAPDKGWEEETLYRVLVAYESTNLVHEAVLWVGFLSNNEEPGTYSRVFNNTYERIYNFHELYYCKVVEKLGKM